MTDPETDTGAASLLLVDDDMGWLRTARRIVGCACRVVETHSLTDAIQVIDGASVVDAAIVDEALPGGSGMDLVRRLRERQPGTPVMLITGHNDSDTRRAALALGVQYVSKTDGGTYIPDFIENVLRTHRALEAFAQDRALTRRQRDILTLAMRGVVVRKDIAQHLQLEETSVKTHIRGLLARCADLQVPSLGDLVRQVRRQAEW
jgi:DNA-binding NarL/FixJ family response regulator